MVVPFLFGSPPAYPVSEPFAPTTRWHGMTIGMGFAPFAAPTARDAVGLAPDDPRAELPAGRARHQSPCLCWASASRNENVYSTALSTDRKTDSDSMINPMR